MLTKNCGYPIVILLLLLLLLSSSKHFYSHKCYQESVLPGSLLCSELPLGRVFYSVKHLDSYESRGLIWLLGEINHIVLQLKSTHFLTIYTAMSAFSRKSLFSFIFKSMITSCFKLSSGRGTKFIGSFISRTA